MLLARKGRTPALRWQSVGLLARDAEVRHVAEVGLAGGAPHAADRVGIKALLVASEVAAVDVASAVGGREAALACAGEALLKLCDRFVGAALVALGRGRAHRAVMAGAPLGVPEIGAALGGYLGMLGGAIKGQADANKEHLEQQGLKPAGINILRYLVPDQGAAYAATSILPESGHLRIR